MDKPLPRQRTTSSICSDMTAARPPRPPAFRRANSAQPAARQLPLSGSPPPPPGPPPATVAQGERSSSSSKRRGAERRACSLPPLAASREHSADLDPLRGSEKVRSPPAQARPLQPRQREAKSPRADARPLQPRQREAGKPMASAPPRELSAPSAKPARRSTSASAGNTTAGSSGGSAHKAAGNATAGTSAGGPQSRFAAELLEWKRRRGVAADAHVFSITGAFPHIRNALLERGWVENEDKSSRIWELRYALWQRDIGELSELDDSQVVNYFARNSELTSKAGLCNNLYSSCMPDRVNVDSFYPRCYDLSNQNQVEWFVEDFKLTTCFCMLRRFVADGGRTSEGGAANGFPRAVVSAALAVCTRRSLSVDSLLDEAPQAPVSEAEWHELEAWSLKKPGHRLKPRKQRGAPAQQAAATAGPATAVGSSAPVGASAARGDDEVASEASDDGAADAAPARDGSVRCPEDEALFQAAHQVLEDLRPQLPQAGLDGFQNIWVLKPAGKSRGRGIQLSARLDNILDVGVGRGAEARWIAQKYIENPMIINSKKFDIRQWVVVTRLNPLAVWFYEDCYLRFSFADYDPKRLKNKYAHLTNNSISKHAEDFDERSDETMIDSTEFQEYLAGLKFERDGRVIEDPWLEVVQPKMKQIVLWSLESTQDAIVPRTSSFELFGYDFMVSEDLDVWLIEVNSSPDLSYSTSTTRTLVKAMLDDLVRVLVDVEKFGVRPDRPKKKWGSCRLNSGRYSLLEPARRRRSEKYGRVRKDAGGLAIHGSGLKLRRPKKGECPRGTDCEEDPRFDALALLAAAEEASPHAPGHNSTGGGGAAAAGSPVHSEAEESEASSGAGKERE
mmetsp:Transcript_126850/g.224794  ORF Transcript_126850/g.224794 Transcript_126850/m.224794 type:complete len:848 (+) Transcript_126850:24-2567(+)